MGRPSTVLVILLALAVAVVPTISMASASPVRPAHVSSETPLVTDAVAVPQGSPTHELPGSTPISISLTLSNPHAAALAQFLAEVENPSSPSFRHFLSYSQYVEQFAPAVSAAAEVSAVLESNGARDLTVAPDRSSVTAVMPAASVQELFGVPLVVYGSSGRIPLYTALGSVSLPSSLYGLVVGVSGLSDASTEALTGLLSTGAFAPAAHEPKEAGFVYDPQYGQDWFVGSDYTQAYGANELFPGPGSVPNATYPTSVAIATLLGSSYNLSSGANLPPWDPSVVDAYFNGTLGPGWPMPSLTGVPVTVDGLTPPLPGSLGGENDSTEFEIENSLDLEMAGSLAPGASLYNFYFAGSLLVGNPANGDIAGDFTQDLADALAYNYSPSHLAVVSCSFGLPDLNNTAWNAELAAAAATGVTIVSASGDQGNAPNSLTGRTDGPSPLWPATAATNTTGAVSVGGVSLTLSGTPSSSVNNSSLNLSYDASAGGISSVTAWWDTLAGPGQYAGSEGGASTVYPEPSWQFDSAAQPAIVNATVLERVSELGRTEPDVAMPANTTIATAFANSTGTIFVVPLEGTSIAAPVLAGLLADVVAVENNRSGDVWSSLGFIDPEIYRMASFFAAFPQAVGDPFSPVTTGHNYLFSAAPGWNPTTGWGGVNAPLFLAADRNTTLMNYRYTGPTPGLPPLPPASGSSVPWTAIFAIFGVGIVVAIILIVLTARSGRRAPPSTTVPWGAQAGGPTFPGAPGALESAPGATMLCPFCGAVRPTEPVRCPRCGAF